MLLDSGAGPGRFHRDDGRYDILVVEPRLTLVTRGPLTVSASADSVQRLSRVDPFDLVRTFLGPRLALAPTGLPTVHQICPSLVGPWATLATTWPGASRASRRQARIR